MLSKELRDMIQSRWGMEVKYSQDCEALAESIFEVTGQKIGVTTVKRMFGFVGNACVVPRLSTMDIIADYLGYSGGMKAMGNVVKTSFFIEEEGVDLESLAEGVQIKFSYKPDRTVVMTHLGNCVFRIDMASNSKLVEGDIVRVACLIVGFEFVASQVLRAGKSLGVYHSAKCGGVSSIKVL